MTKTNGFTLIELMIVVAIIAILASIAYPSYVEYVKRTNRADVQTEMMQTAQRLQSYFVINHNYTNAKLVNNLTTQDYPANGAFYTITLVTNAQTYNLTATPKAGTSQFGDGHIVLNSNGQKCWIKGSDRNSGSACTPSVTTSWSNN